MFTIFQLDDQEARFCLPDVRIKELSVSQSKPAKKKGKVTIKLANQ